MHRILVCLAAILLLHLENCATTYKVPVGEVCSIAQMDCTENAYCMEIERYSEYGICKCNAGRFAKSKNGDTCVQKPSHGDPCKFNTVFESERCYYNQGLLCQPRNSTSRKRSAEEDEHNGICRCPPDSIWGPTIHTCFPTDCSKRFWLPDTLFPHPNSETSSSNKSCKVKIGISIPYNYFEDLFLECPTNSSLQLKPSNYAYGSSEGICICDPGFITSSDKRSCILQKSYGESCDLELGESCNKAGLLTCSIDKLTCECGHSATWNNEDSVCYSAKECARRNRGSFYDPNSGKCLTKIDNQCSLGNTTPSSTQQMFPCPTNASCTMDSFSILSCKCDTGFIKNEYGEKCFALKSMGEDCVWNLSACDPGQHTSCQNGACVCTEKSIWNESKKDCVALAGGVCGHRSGWKTCTRQASCRRPTSSFGTRINDEYCECNEGQMEMEDGTCLSKYMNTCESSAHCVPGTSCIDNVCMCPNPVQSIFDEGESKCFALEGSTCASNGSVEYSPCISNSECVNNVCKCQEGYSKTFSGTCLLVHGEDCSDDKGACNFNQGLACVNNRCECIDSILKFVDGAGCVGHEGLPCGMVIPVPDCTSGRTYGDTRSIKNCDHYFVQCDFNSECKDFGGGRTRCEVHATSSDSAPSTLSK